MATSNRERKKKARQKRLAKERNVRRNQKEVKFYLEVDFAEEGGWKRMINFYTAAEVNKHIEDTEAIREAGDTRIFAGVVKDVNGKVVKRVEAYEPDVVTPSDGEATQNLEAVK
jgi:hypothetical protein